MNIAMMQMMAPKSATPMQTSSVATSNTNE